MAGARHILVVDDNATNSGILALLLRQEGYGVTCAGHGVEALDYLRAAEPPLCILLDMAMPVMDGWAFRQVQLQDPALAPIPVILISAEGDLAEVAGTMAVTSYFCKPVDFEQLLGAIRQIGDTGNLWNHFSARSASATSA